MDCADTVIAEDRSSSRYLAQLKAWLHAQHGLRDRLINIGHLLSGNAVSALIALVGVAVTARALGPSQYGVMALVLSYGRIIEKVVRFESWQPLIKYAAAETGPDAPDRLRLLYAFGLRLDAAACLIAAVTAFTLAVLAGPLFGLRSEHIRLVAICSLALAVQINGMPSAVLRMGGRFRTVAGAQIATNVLRVGLFIVGWWSGGSLEYFVWAWALSQAAGAVLFLGLAFAELRRREVYGVLTAPWRGMTKPFPGIVGFAWSANLSITLRSSSHDLDVLLVGLLSNPAAAGVYYIAKSFARVVQQANTQVQAVLYPDVARLWVEAKFKTFLAAVRQLQVLLGALFVVAFLGVALLGHWILLLGPGRMFLAAQPLLLVQIVAVWLTTHSAPSRTALLAMGRQRSVLVIVLVGTIAFHSVMLTLVPRIGAMGANIAHVVLAAICAVAMEWKVRQGVREARAEVAATEIQAPPDPPD